MLGSGYLLGGGLVLTSRHVVDHCESEAWDVRRRGERDWVGAECVWRGERCDAALLRVAAEDGCGDVAAQLGRVSGDEHFACRALGFPLAQSREGGQVRDTEDLGGEIAPLTGSESGLLTIHIIGSVPLPDQSGHSPWEGMSGAALFSGPLIVGVIVIDPAHFGTDRLEAVPVTMMVAEPDFREVVAGDVNATIILQAAEDVDATRGVLRAPHRPLPTKATPERLRQGGSHFLLAAEYGIVPFHGRAEKLAELEEWCGGETGLELALAHGSGGTGKTRFAAELCRHALRDGMVAGFLEVDASADGIAALGIVTAPLLVVVDEAPGRVDQVATLLTRLARSPTERRMRVLLLARRLGEWWDVLLPRQLHAEPDALWAHNTAAAHALEPVDDTVAGRARAFADAAAAFSARTGRGLSELRYPDLTKGIFEQILFVHLAALAAIEGEHDPLEGQVFRDDLLRGALAREAVYWADTASAIGLKLGPVPIERAVALATLTVAHGEDEAARTLTCVPDLIGASEERRREIARWLRELYAPSVAPQASDATAEPWFRPLTPVPLGEALVEQTLESAPRLLSDLLEVATPAQARRALTVMTQTVNNYGRDANQSRAAVALRCALDKHLGTHWREVLEVAQEAGDPLGRYVADSLHDSPNPELANSIERALPERSVALRELAFVATDQSLDHVGRQRQSIQRDAEIARLLHAMSWRLVELGRPLEEATGTAHDAWAMYERLADADPDSFLPHLARSLKDWAEILARVEDWDEALDAVDNAEAIYHRLTQDRPEMFLPDLAALLHNKFIVERGRLGPGRNEVLEPIEKAVKIYRRLAADRRDRFEPELASSLRSQGRALAGLGQVEALKPLTEAVEIHRRLADDRPDAFLPELATSLHGYGVALAELGRSDRALEPIKEALKIRGRLAKARPVAFLPPLARSLHAQTLMLAELGRIEQAFASTDEEVEVYSWLTKAFADAFLPDLRRSLTNRSKLLHALGRDEEAGTAAEEAEAIRSYLEGPPGPVVVPLVEPREPKLDLE
jgi:tetratricopeptide (TPR) repeat protein